MDKALFKKDPRGFALDLVENGLVDKDTLITAMLKYMSTDDVREMLDMNELSPRFSEDDDDDDDDDEDEDED